MNLMDESRDELGAEDLLKRGSQQLKRGDAKGALEAAREAARLAPDNPRAKLLAGSCLLHDGRHEEAAQTLTEATKLAPGEPTAYYQLAVTLREQGELAAALEMLKAAPPDLDVRRLRGYVQFELGDFDAAVESFEAALMLEPSDALAREGQALALGRLGRRTRVHELLSQCAGEADAVAGLISGDGWALMREERYEDALERFERALAKDAAHANAWHGKVACLRVMRDTDGADATLRRAPADLPNRRALLTEQGWLRLDQDRKEDALAAFDEVLRDDPGNEFAVSGMARAQRLLGRHDDAAQTLAAVPEARRRTPRYQMERALLALAVQDAGDRQPAALAEAVEAFQAW
jgi:Flp pilus assembly protein TadD